MIYVQMGQTKLKIVRLIESTKMRNSSYKTRKASIEKKLYELSTLCNVEASFIVYGPMSSYPAKLDTWPRQAKDKLLLLLNKYILQLPDERDKKTFSLSNYFENCKKKGQSNLDKLRKQNDKARYPEWEPRYDGMDKYQLMSISNVLEIKFTDAMFWQLNYKHIKLGEELLKQPPPPYVFNNNINQYDVFDEFRINVQNSLYDYRLEQRQISSFDTRMEFIPNQNMVSLIDNDNNYVKNIFCDENVVNGPMFKREPEFFGELVNDPMFERIGIVNNLMRAPQMSYNGALPMPQYTTAYGVTRQPMPRYTIEYHVGGRGDQMPDFDQMEVLGDYPKCDDDANDLM